MPFCLTYSRSDNVCKYLCSVSFPLLCYFVVVNSCHLYSLVTCNFVFVLATAIVIDVTVKKARWNCDLIAVIHWVGDPVTQATKTGYSRFNLTESANREMILQ